MSDGDIRTVLLALGSNAGTPMRHLRNAMQGLGEALDDVTISAVYRTPPEGVRSMEPQNDRCTSSSPPKQKVPGTALQNYCVSDSHSQQDRGLPQRQRILDPSLGVSLPVASID